MTTTTSEEIISATPPVTLEFVRRLSDKSVARGRNVLLQCTSNDPAATTYWLHNGEELNPDSPPHGLAIHPGVLFIARLQSQLTGTYRCEIENDLATIADQATVTMDMVYCGIEYTSQPTALAASVGGAATFTVLTTNAAQIEWKKRAHDGSERRLRQGGRYAIPSNGVLLHIENICLSDFGEYIYVVHNRDRTCQEERSVELTVWHDCGQPMIAPAERATEELLGHIVGGSDAAYGSAPWMAMLYEATSGAFCGGVLIDKRSVLTAAHCIRDFERTFERRLLAANLRVKLGKQRRSDHDEHERSVLVSRIIYHRDFDNATRSDSYNHDIALLKLATDAPASQYIMPICLATPSVYESEFRPGSMGTVTGWGHTAEAGPMAVNLQEIQLPLQTRAVCERSTTYRVEPGMLCAGYSQEVEGDACKGDSGGPYIMKHQERWYLVGLVSWGEGCAQEGKYGFYTRISRYYRWIMNQLHHTCMHHASP